MYEACKILHPLVYMLVPHSEPPTKYRGFEMTFGVCDDDDNL
jgi:hypothetical protein